MNEKWLAAAIAEGRAVKGPATSAERFVAATAYQPPWEDKESTNYTPPEWESGFNTPTEETAALAAEFGGTFISVPVPEEYDEGWDGTIMILTFSDGSAAARMDIDAAPDWSVVTN